ncbi:Uncharacterised protein [Klebsiella pneumoniae]|jgi:hypothetical protein|nr:hypothetical protein CIA_04076 [Pseudomonas aeruginosa PA14]CRX28840.1 hypothetical protein PAERUG_P54_1_London_24_VIM_2_04_13_05315 [Pseudomonas aeruginosa]SPZ07026.1 Uncharacterised protein [Pseudomonas aeruginosa]SVJ80790.1 Uncharacterised protein [Klebsiella pneumoniae]
MVSAISMTSAPTAISASRPRSTHTLWSRVCRKLRANWQPNSAAEPIRNGVAAFAHQGLSGQKYSMPAPFTETW